jgi:carbamoylphosphate synthase large subunit
MNVAYTPETLAEYLREATGVSPDHPVVISKFIIGERHVMIIHYNSIMFVHLYWLVLFVYVNLYGE